MHRTWLKSSLIYLHFLPDCRYTCYTRDSPRGREHPTRRKVFFFDALHKDADYSRSIPDGFLVFPEHTFPGTGCIHENHVERTLHSRETIGVAIGDNNMIISPFNNIFFENGGSWFNYFVGNQQWIFGQIVASSVDLPPGAAHRSRTRRGVYPVICWRTTCRNMEEASCT